jgi:molecular chaperone GrpE
MKKDEGGVAGLLRGVEATDRLLNRVLDKHGVRKFSPIGQKFDPHRHQAIYEVEDGAKAPGTVVEVVQPGYSIGERVLRPALVAVSAPPKSRPEAEVTAAKTAAADTAGTAESPPGGG